MADSNIVSGVIGVVGVLIGVAFKEGWTQTQSERRANGKVLAAIRRAYRECSTINVKLRQLPGYAEDEDFSTRQALLWDLMKTSEEAEANNVLSISPAFSRAYWRFVNELEFEGSEDFSPKDRYTRAQADFEKWLPRLQATANGDFRRSLALIAALLIAGFAAGAVTISHWSEIIGAFTRLS